MRVTTGPTSLDLLRTRGDTYPHLFYVVDAAGGADDITGRAYTLTVDTRRSPPDETTKVFSILGVVIDGPAGAVTFSPTAPDADQTPGSYFYDIQQTDAGGAIRTVARGRYVFTQDITK